MAVLLNIKSVPAYKEITVKVNGVKLPTTFGIKIYPNTKLEEVKKEFSKIALNSELDKAQAELLDLQKSGDKTSDAYYQLRDNLRDRISDLQDLVEQRSLAFYKQQVLFIKNATLSFAPEEGAPEKDVTVADTRTAVELEPLWKTPEECLSVLLDIYFDNSAIGGSLIQEITQYIFNLSLETSEKVKN